MVIYGVYSLMRYYSTKKSRNPIGVPQPSVLLDALPALALTKTMMTIDARMRFVATSTRRGRHIRTHTNK